MVLERLAALAAAAPPLAWAGALLGLAVLAWLLGEGSAAPRVEVEETEAEREDVLAGRATLDPASATPRVDRQPRLIRCWDPTTMQDLGTVPVSSPEDVRGAIGRARAAQRVWAGSSFAQRRDVQPRDPAARPPPRAPLLRARRQHVPVAPRDLVHRREV